MIKQQLHVVSITCSQVFSLQKVEGLRIIHISEWYIFSNLCHCLKVYISYVQKIIIYNHCVIFHKYYTTCCSHVQIVESFGTKILLLI